MRLRILVIILLSSISAEISCQAVTEINKTDQLGKKQGAWIKKYPNGNVQYEGTFKDDHPAGEFKRYYEDRTLMSVMIYSDDGRSAEATVYHPNGFISSQGKYSDQKKDGKWKFFSETTDGCLISEDEYYGNIRNGISVKYYPDGTIAERLRYINDKKDGEWLQYYEDGNIFLKSNYSGGMLNGKFEVFYQNGRLQYTGFYKNNLRDGKWLIYNENGTLKYEINYTAGITKDRQMVIDASEYIDSLERNKDKIVDPEKPVK